MNASYERNSYVERLGCWYTITRGQVLKVKEKKLGYVVILDRRVPIRWKNNSTDKLFLNKTRLAKGKIDIKMFLEAPKIFHKIVYDCESRYIVKVEEYKVKSTCTVM